VVHEALIAIHALVTEQDDGSCTAALQIGATSSYRDTMSTTLVPGSFDSVQAAFAAAAKQVADKLD